MMSKGKQNEVQSLMQMFAGNYSECSHVFPSVVRGWERSDIWINMSIYMGLKSD